MLLNGGYPCVVSVIGFGVYIALVNGRSGLSVWVNCDYLTRLHSGAAKVIFDALVGRCAGFSGGILSFWMTLIVLKKCIVKNIS